MQTFQVDFLLIHLFLSFKLAQTANKNLCEIISFYLKNLDQFLSHFDNQQFDSFSFSLLGNLLE